MTPPWLVWLSGLSASLWTQRLSVGFPLRAPAWVVGQVPGWGLARDNQLQRVSPYLPPFPSRKMNKIFKKENDSKVSIKFLYLRFQENEVFVGICRHWAGQQEELLAHTRLFLPAHLAAVTFSPHVKTVPLPTVLPYPNSLAPLCPWTPLYICHYTKKPQHADKCSLCAQFWKLL